MKKNQLKYTSKEFIDKANKIHGNKYLYASEYTGSRDFIDIICPTHGKFSVRAYSHLEGSRCHECDVEQRSNANKYTHEEFLIRAQKVHKNNYSYSEQYQHSNKLLTITCQHHGNFQQLPYTHLLGNGCKKCAIKTILVSQRSNTTQPIDENTPGILYILESDFDGGLYKLGITIDLKQRLRSHPAHLKYKVLWQQEMTLFNALDIEQAIKEDYKEHKKYKHISKEKYFPGYTECFRLDSNLIEKVEAKIKTIRN